ncbi:MAG: radical SAM protein [Verrucomicrobiota bacterium]|jgi:radical SAM superfamily enzyme YgiQ (UPF0313 family)
MNKLLLIAPLGKTGFVSRDMTFRLPCLGLLRVAALTPPGWDVTIIDEKVEQLDLTQSPDLVGITVMTITSQRAYEIADHFRRRGIKVVIGGMHASCLPDEALAHCDSVVVGEAEQLWPIVLANFERGDLKRIYQHQNGLPSLDGMPPVDWELYRKKHYLPVHFLETTRGCPLDCEFCAVTNAFGGRYRNRPLDDVLAELRRLRPFDGLLTLKNCVFFVDDNIISNRAYARELFTRLADFKIKWFSQASMNVANDPEILKLCQRSGCIGLFIGFESFSKETLRSIGHKPNNPEHYLETVRKIHDHGIGVDASFVFGFDTDDEGVFNRTVDFVLRAKVEVVYFSILTPYPGTRLFRRLQSEGRLLTTDWTLYDTGHVVYRPKTFTSDQLLDGYYRALKETYTINSIFKRLWGTTAYKNFFYPMNFGFRRGANALWRAYRKGAMRLESVVTIKE